jgi:dTDP-4-dehydrorhamnose 3,5-epimerase
MQLRETLLPGVWTIDIDAAEDERGFFARTFCADTFGKSDLVNCFPQCSISFNRKRGTLRGMHLQCEPYGEAKLVRCTSGILFDVAVDLRRGSPTFGRWVGFELSAENRRSLYISAGLAHGFLTLADATEVFYQISRPYVPEAFRGLRWDDPDIAIAWPIPVSVISQRDAVLPRLNELFAKHAIFET